MPFVRLAEDPRFEAARPLLVQRLDALAGAWDVAAFREALRGPAREELLDAFGAVGASEGTLWIVDAAGEALVPAFNSGPAAAEFMERVRQPLSRGIISMVAATEQPFCENEVHQHAAHDKTVDRLVGAWTLAMIAVPFYFAGRLRGVVSCVRLSRPDGASAPGEHAAVPPAADADRFSLAHMRRVQRAAGALTVRFEHATLRAGVGWPDAGDEGDA